MQTNKQFTWPKRVLAAADKRTFCVSSMPCLKLISNTTASKINLVCFVKPFSAGRRLPEELHQRPLLLRRHANKLPFISQSFVLSSGALLFQSPGFNYWGNWLSEHLAIMVLDDYLLCVPCALAITSLN